jgi:hypothetical protein
MVRRFGSLGRAEPRGDRWRREHFGLPIRPSKVSSIRVVSEELTPLRVYGHSVFEVHGQAIVHRDHVQPSASTRVSGLPALTKGSMAAMAGVILASESPSSRWDRSSALADFMKTVADTVPGVTTDQGEANVPGPLLHHLSGH